jgi:hypothetical protein
MAEDSAGDSRTYRRLSVWLGAAAAIVGVATGILTLRDQIFGSDPQPQPPAQAQAIPYFQGVAGHVERSTDLIGFFKNHDGDAVRLQVGFDVGLDDYSVDGFGAEPYEAGSPPRVDLYTDCTPPLSPTEQEQVDLGFSDALPPPRCMTWEILVQGPDNDESGIYVMHGTPRLEGYFLVDIGDLQMGITPIGLEPMTFGEAQARTPTP